MESIRGSADGENYEILIRMESDDKASLALTPKLREHLGTQVFVGSADGYAAIGRHFTYLSALASGQWVWIFNDDMTIASRDGGWDTKLAQVPKHGYFVEPQTHKLNRSTYPNDPRCGAPALIRNCWSQFGITELPASLDYRIPERLEKVGWKPWFLDGVTIWHDRDEAEIRRRK